MMAITETQGRLLDLVQKDFPWGAKPFDELGAAVNISGGHCIEELAILKREGVIRDISGIFNGPSFGYETALVALKPGKLAPDDAAAIISSHPGVSHNYLRDNDYSLWFTLAEESPEEFLKTVEYFKAVSGADDILIFRNERLLKIGVHFSSAEDSGTAGWRGEIPPGRTFDEREREAVLLLQKELPLTERPWDALCEGSSMRSDILLRYRRSFTNSGIMRRYAAVVRHARTGHTSNAMTAWKKSFFSEEDFNLFLGEKRISHLYLRTPHEEKWGYPLFAMVHAKSDHELDETLARLSRETGADYLSLRTLKEYKKNRVTWFSPRFREWKEERL